MKKVVFAAVWAILFASGLSMAQTQQEYWTLPYVESFNMRNSPDEDHPGPETEEDYRNAPNDPNFYRVVKENWTFRSSDNNSITWRGADLEEQDATGSAVSFKYNEYLGEWCTAGLLILDIYGEQRKGMINDWLIMRKPVRIEKNAYVSFFLVGQYGDFDLPIEVWYGETPEPGDEGEGWKKLSTMVIPQGYSYDWKEYLSETVEVDETKDYYFAVRFNFDGKKFDISHYIRIDELCIAEGEARGEVDVALQKVILPSIGCGTQEASVDVVVKNLSSISVEGIICEATVYYNEEYKDFISDTIREPIAAGSSQTFTLSRKVDFSAVGNYEVIGELVVLPSEKYDPEEEITNNAAKAQTQTMLPMTLPVDFDFWGLHGNEEAYWSSPEDPEAWNVIGESKQGWEAVKEGFPLVSTCLNMPAGEYVFRWKYQMGISTTWSGTHKEDYEIRLGKQGTDVSDWKVIDQGEDILCYNWDEAEHWFRFKVEEDGDYQVAIINTGSTQQDNPWNYEKHFGIYSVYISEAGPDLACIDLYGDYLNANTPKEHLAWKMPVSAVVTNQGVGKQMATVELSLDGTKVGTSEPFIIEEGGSTVAEVMMSIPKDIVYALPETYTSHLQATVKLAQGTDMFESNNTYDFSFTANDDLWGAVRPRGIEGGLYYSTDFGVAAVVHLLEPDTLTSIVAAFRASGTVGDAKIRVSVRAVGEIEEDGSYPLMGTYCSEIVTRKGADGEQEYKIKPVLLGKGSYAIIAEQIMSVWEGALMIACDYTKGSEAKGYMMSLDGGYITKINPDEAGFGNLYIRAKFGHDAEDVYDTDLAVSDMTRPLESGLFAENQAVTAKVSNLSIAEVKDVTVYCLVNKKLYEKKIASLGVGEQKEVTFEADLSAPGDYWIRVFTAFEGDANPKNDTVSRTVNCQVSADPYKMNFENCADWSFDSWNPGWKAVDEDGLVPWTRNGLNFEGMYAPFAFVVLNAASDENLASLYPPYEGDKVGLSMSPVLGPGADWIISPKLAFGEEASVSFQSYQEFLENVQMVPSSCEVYVSLTGNQLSDFTDEGFLGSIYAGRNDWQGTTYRLDEYAGKSGYIAIKVVSDKNSYVTLIDDIIVEKGKVSNAEYAGDIAVNLYPNPVSDILTVSSDEVLQQVSLFSASGQNVYESPCGGKTECRIQVKNFAPGIYFVRVRTSGGVMTGKVLIR